MKLLSNTRSYTRNLRLRRIKLIIVIKRGMDTPYLALCRYKIKSTFGNWITKSIHTCSVAGTSLLRFPGFKGEKVEADAFPAASLTSFSNNNCCDSSFVILSDTLSRLDTTEESCASIPLWNAWNKSVRLAEWVGVEDATGESGTKDGIVSPGLQ